MRHANLQELMTIEISINFNGVSKNDAGTEEPFEESFGTCLAVGESDAEDTAEFLKDIAEAIDSWNLYGFMLQEMVSAQLAAGDIREEAASEVLRRVSANAQPMPEPNTGECSDPEKLSSTLPYHLKGD